VIVDVTANDYSPQGLTVAVHSITGQPANGTATVINGNDIEYTPNPNFTGYDFFIYQACDNGTPSLCNIARVWIYVDSCNVPPAILNTAGGVATDTINLTVNEDSSINYCFTYSYTDSPQVYIASITASADTVTANSTNPGTNPCISIKPPFNSRAQQSFNVVICSETPACDTVTVVVTIIPVHHAPIAKNDSISYVWYSPCSSVNVISNDSIIDPGDNIVLTHFDSATASGGKVTEIGDSILCYSPDSTFAGLDTFYYTICNTNALNLCATAYVIVTVPVLAHSDNAMTQEDTAVTINVTANDTRTANEYITFCSLPQHGTVTIDSGNVVLYTPVQDYPVDPISTDTLVYVGIDSFCYTLCAQIGQDTSCSSTQVYIQILPLAKFYIPQGISPNGDGINDLFVIASADQFPLSQLLVYNRYGDEVWRNDNNGYQNNFDGTWKKNGQPLPDGSYWYIFKFNDGINRDRMGYIVIQR